jgi:proteasome lid subunit RPN8/RPN11
VHRRRDGYRDHYRVVALRITLHVLNGMISHARDASPFECCGLLAGKDDVIDEYVRTHNIRESQVEYEIDPREHIAVRKSLRARGRSVVGAYHSHPRTAAVPSAKDVAEAHYEQGFLYAIVSLEHEPPDVGVYRMEKGKLVTTAFEALP